LLRPRGFVAEISFSSVDALALELDRLRAARAGCSCSASAQRRQLQSRRERFSEAVRIEAYSPVDNVSELTARTNDEGWETVFAAWLEISQLTDKDAILIYSVGGGDAERNISPNIVNAVDLAKARGARVFGIVGRDSGYTAKHGDVVVVIRRWNRAGSRHSPRLFRRWSGIASSAILLCSAGRRNGRAQLQLEASCIS